MIKYDLQYLKNILTNDSSKIKNRALEDAVDIVSIVNSLIMRLNKKEESTLEPLTFKINSYLSKFGLSNWSWSSLINNANTNINDKNIVYKHNKENQFNRSIDKEKEHRPKSILLILLEGKPMVPNN